MAQFKKGNPGRPKGAKNKAGSELREFLAGTLEDNKEKFAQTLKNLTKGEFIKLYLECLRFTLPTLKSVEIRQVPEVEELLMLSSEERRSVLLELKQQLKDEKQTSE